MNFPSAQRVLDGIEKSFRRIFDSRTSRHSHFERCADSRRRCPSRLDKAPRFNRPQTCSRFEGLIQSALDSIRPPSVTLEKAAARVEAFHRKQPLTSWFTNELGGTIGQIIRPIQRVGLYVPGGTAPLPSTVLMSAIPAKVAGVKEIVVVTPPNKAFANAEVPIDPIILAACAVAGVDEIYAARRSASHCRPRVWH
jgi:histidinol dehydrogenase